MSCCVANKAIVDSRGQFYNERIEAAANDSRRRWSAIRDVLHLTTERDPRSDEESTQLCDGFAQFFVDKIRKVKAAIKTRLADSVDDALQSDHRHIGPLLADVRLPTTQEVYKLICFMPGKSSPLDKIPTSVIKTCAVTFAPLICRLTTLSFFQDKFPSCYTHASVTPLLKKQGLDSNYRPVSNLHTISKIVERLFMTRLVEHVLRSPSYNRFQSAYRRGHSTKTALTFE